MVLVDAGLVETPLGGQKTGPNPTDRGRCGSKYHLMTTRSGVPLAVTVTEATARSALASSAGACEVSSDWRQAGPAAPHHGDKGYDCQAARTLLA